MSRVERMNKTKDKTQETIPEKNKKSELNGAELATMTTEERIKAITKSHSTLIKISLVLAVISILCVVSLFVVIIQRKPEPKYFASTTDGRILPLVALDQPLLSLASVESFAGKAISQLFTFDYVNYQQQMTEHADDFTSEAFTEIKNTLQNNDGLLTEAIKNNWVVTATIMSAPQVVNQGEIGKSGVYGWRLIYPVMMTFQSEHSRQSARYTADVIVIRVKQTDNPTGIAIKSLILSPYRY